MLSAAIFSPQSSPPSTTHLAYVRARLCEDPCFKSLRDAVVQLPETWQALASLGQDISLPDAAIRALHSFPRWIENGESDVLERDMSGIVSLPLLTIVHIVQYLCYLEAMGLTHSEFLHSVELGGVQGYCIGLLSAVIVASSKNEQEVVQHAVTGIRLALGIGAFGDLSQVWSTSGSNTLQSSLRKPDDVDEMLRKFPAVSIPSPPSPILIDHSDSGRPLFPPSRNPGPCASLHLKGIFAHSKPTQTSKDFDPSGCIFEATCTTRRTRLWHNSVANCLTRHRSQLWTSSKFPSDRTGLGSCW